MFKVCLHLNQLNRRGVEVANYVYVTELQNLHGGKMYEVSCVTPQFVLDEQAPEVPDVIEKFNETCGGSVHGYVSGGHGWEERAPGGAWRYGGPNLVLKLRELRCDMLYGQKAGDLASPPQFDERSLRIPWAVHAVFSSHDPHGTSYAAISQEISSLQCVHDDNHSMYVDYIVDTSPEEITMNVTKIRIDKRVELGIPDDALVLCRHGGRDTFNIDFVRESVHALVSIDERVHVVLMNTAPLARKHARIHEVKGESTTEGKAKFFALCDAMLHARADGETFGMAVAEFSLRNKPVITYNGENLRGYLRAHVNILGDKAIYYRDISSLNAIVDQLVTEGVPKRSWDAYSSYTAERIMPKFERYLIEPALKWWEEVQSRGIDDVWSTAYDDLPSLDRRCT